ncbi:MAG: cell division protein FtsA, partial [Candidatus Aminicenantes bacterium]|nr:cell division protein FtsA [Candidatus Aminicenantes bacterium]
MRKRTLVGVDVGTTKVCSVIAQLEQEVFRVSGVGITPSAGLKKGVVVNLTETIESVKRSLDQAERDARVGVDTVFVS